MKTFTYDKMPHISELWDDCVNSLVYDPNEYTDDLERLFKKLKINTESKILDSSAGSGFPALELAKRGYSVDCMDVSKEAIEIFNRKAHNSNLDIKCKQLSWLEIPNHYSKDNFDLLFCRGNSFIYAAGGWDSESKTSREIALENYEKTLKVFYDSIKPGGSIYIDKFKDSEEKSKAMVGKIKIGEEEYDWYFHRNPMEESKTREAGMILRDKRGKENPIVSFQTYLLSENELTGLMKKVGFSDIEKITLESETHFDIWLARK